MLADGTLLAAGDTGGMVSAWDVPQGCLLSAAQVHEGYVSSCCWSSTSSICPAANTTSINSSGSSGTGGSRRSARDLKLISCSYDGTLSVLQVCCPCLLDAPLMHVPVFPVQGTLPLLRCRVGVNGCCPATESCTKNVMSDCDLQVRSVATTKTMKDIVDQGHDHNYTCVCCRYAQVDPSIYRQYCAAFCGLYYTCKKNNKVWRGVAEQRSKQQGVSPSLVTAQHALQ